MPKLKWFPHDTAAYQDDKIIALTLKYGREGKCVYYDILEVLYGNCKPIHRDILAHVLRLDKRLKRVLDYIIEIGLLECENGLIFSERINSYILSYFKENENAKKRMSEYRERQRVANNVTRNDSVTNGERNANVLFLYLYSVLGNAELARILEEGELEGSKEIQEELSQDSETKIFTKNEKEMHSYAVVEMAKIFRDKNPHYFFDKETDYHACLQIGWHIAKVKGWRKMETLGANQPELLKSWKMIVDFIATDDWLKGRCLSDLATIKQWQRLVNEMEKSKAKEIPISDYQKNYKEQLEKYKNRGSVG